ncbi:gluconokinase [[Phormidium ambiguum] IAM M-71]|uniref:Gluconokinase n=1 Tax=[Phormidium ambiguum] IAM M-71 TaxID=454136 RepID=A0A1U7IQ41_9CYAN|nr:gluconokinase [Phormidium ambiguum]OKH39432.1 gluconokinase [Phormidium ambiguum IAM M-71]
MSYVIAVDIGTTSTKSVLFSETGKMLQRAAVDYPLLTPVPGAAEQEPETIFSAVLTTVQQVIETSKINPAEILCLSFSSAMHSLIAVDNQGKLLTKSITWADNRSAKWAEIVQKEKQGKEIYLRTGTPIHPMSPLIKIIWLREEYPEVFAKAAKFISIKEYIFYQLFGEYVIDYSIASTTGLFNLINLNWDREALELASITEHHLSRLVPTTHIFQSLREEYALVMGIPSHIPTVIGAADGVLSNLGVGAIAPGIVAVTIGTSGAIRVVVDRPICDPKQRLFCYALTENYWVIGGAVNNGGIILRWIRDNLADAEVLTAKTLKQDPYNMLTAIAQTVPAGAEGLIFHPYLTGERSPIWNANARGSFIGLSLRHTKAHLVRSMLEGVVYNLYLVLQALEDFAGEINSIRASGGFANSYLWRQILADVFNQPVSVPEIYESSSFGAAILGLYAIKKITSLEQLSQEISLTYHHQPIPENVAIYQKIIPVYSRILDNFQEIYTKIAELQKED